MIDELSKRNTAKILLPGVDRAKRARLLSMQIIMNEFGDTQMDKALQLVVETAIMCWVEGQFDMLHTMARSIIDTEIKGGRA